MIVFSIGFILPITWKVGPISSANTSEDTNWSIDPLYFLHITDTHVHGNYEPKNPNLVAVMESIKKFKSNVIFHTGDLVDNYITRNWPKYGHQVIEDWICYHNFMSNYSKDYEEFIEIPGNHDMTGIKSSSSQINFFSKYSMISQYYNFENASLLRVFMRETKDYTFIGFNPYYFPNPHPCFDFWAHATKEILDELEYYLKIAPSGKPLFVGCHYPVSFIKSSKSSSGKNFVEIIESNKVTAFLSGHIHGDSNTINHHGNALEVIGGDVKENRVDGLATYDNGRFSYTSMVSENASDFVLTHPIPKVLTSSKTRFNEYNAPIRVLCFGFNNKTIPVKCSVSGTMQYQK